MAFILGIDTGGTYTDGVLIDAATKKVCQKAKALTTSDDLVTGIGNCLNELHLQKNVEINMVCLSTTLATNAVIEGKGCDTGLILLGKEPPGEFPVKQKALVKGLLDIQGKLVEDLDEAAVLRNAREMSGKVKALTISGYASIRNPEHELKAKALARSVTSLPVICAHELTGKLGYYERTVTAVLNARLIPIIKRLLCDVKTVLQQKAINAPVMIMKGDGSFMTSAYAGERTVETILSGPAASVVGAMRLAGHSEATIIDMGGTTSDIALVENGHVKIIPEGAKVGGWKTHVRAADIVTFGIGGDSKMRVKRDKTITFGPDKAVPISYFANEKSERLDKLRACLDDNDVHGEYGFTPTDLAHIQGIYNKWKNDSAWRFLDMICAKYGYERDGLIQNIEQALFDTIADALKKSRKIKAGIPLIGVGAPAGTWLRIFAEKQGMRVIVPEHAEVANAIGAAVGQIEEKAEVLIRYDDLSGKYVGHLPDAREEFDTLEEAKRICVEKTEGHVREKVRRCGGEECEVLKEQEDIFCDSYDGKQQNYVETKMTFIAVGKPECMKKGER